MVMFKHGVAYVERSGPADGPFELSFKRDEMNDVLKSLAAWVAKGDAIVGAVAFEAPEDPELLLSERKLLFPPNETLGGLVRSLRGRRVALHIDGARHEGEVLGLDVIHGGDRPTPRSLLVRKSDDRVDVLDVGRATAIELLEAPSRADVELVVDRSRAATSGENRTVTVGITGRAEDLRVSYVVPSPVWRVSYRLVHDAEGLLVMAWGIVHNPVDEDLEEVELTLTTGQPVSFVIDLYQPKRVERAIVEETVRVAAPTARFERGAPPPPPAAAPMGGPAGFGPPGMIAPAPTQAPPPRPQPMEAAALAQAAQGAAEGADRGELFEYRVSSPVSLKRGGSAMVPLVGVRIPARKERIWRDGQPPNPDIVLTFENRTNVVLEEGPAVVYDEGSYAGEAMVPYSARGIDVRLGFAKDLAVRCRRQSKQSHVSVGVRLGSVALVEEQRFELRHTLSAESDHAEPVDVVFELPKVHGRSISPEHAQPTEETASFRRFVLRAEARGTATLEVEERWVTSQHVRYEHLTAAHLDRWLAGRFLDRAATDELSGVLALWSRAQDCDNRAAEAEKRQQNAYQKQTKISEQLAVLKEGGPEGNLRLRYVQELAALQDEVNAREQDALRYRTEAAEAREQATAKLADITRRRATPGPSA